MLCVVRIALVFLLLCPVAARAERVEINAAGDVSWPSIGFDLEQVDRRGVDLFELVKPHLSTADLNFANLECPFTERPTTLRKTYSYACAPGRLDYLIEAGFNLFSLSNNHALDAGDEGVADTRAALTARITDGRPLFFAGTGATPEAAQLPLVFQLPGKQTKIAFFALSNAPPTSVVASLGSPGIVDRVIAAARVADVVIVSVHNGPEYVHVATAETVRRYHELIDAGADVVLGHHPHVVQGIERYRGGVIFYSLGNFSFASHTLRHKETGARLYSMLGRVVLEDGAVESVTVVPLYVNNAEPWTLAGETLEPRHCTPQPLWGAFARHMLAELQDFSAALPGASPTRILVEGDTGRVVPSTQPIAVKNPSAVTVKRAGGKARAPRHRGAPLRRGAGTAPSSRATR
jgi:hypothetical protein